MMFAIENFLMRHRRRRRIARFLRVIDATAQLTPLLANIIADVARAYALAWKGTR